MNTASTDRSLIRQESTGLLVDVSQQRVHSTKGIGMLGLLNQRDLQMPLHCWGLQPEDVHAGR